MDGNVRTSRRRHRCCNVVYLHRKGGFVLLLLLLKTGRQRETDVRTSAKTMLADPPSVFEAAVFATDIATLGTNLFLGGEIKRGHQNNVERRAMVAWQPSTSEKNVLIQKDRVSPED